MSAMQKAFVASWRSISVFFMATCIHATLGTAPARGDVDPLRTRMANEAESLVMSASPTGYSLPSQLPGPNGGPRVVWSSSGLNAVGTAGPYARAAASGTNASSSVFLGNGGSYVRQADFYLPLNGLDWFHERIYSSQSSSSANWQGEGWFGTEMMNITVDGTDGASDVHVEMDPHYTLDFTYSGGSWTCDDNFLYALTYSSGSKEYMLKRPDGFTYVFHNKAPGGNNIAKRLKRIKDPYGNYWSFTYAGFRFPMGPRMTRIVVDVVEGNDHSITYSYFSSGDNLNKLQYIKAYKTTTETSANLIGQIEHVYHGSGSDAYGKLGDLMKAIVKRKGTADGDGVLSIKDDYHYRYYKGTYNSSTNPGTDHQLKYVLNPENSQRLNDDKGNPLTQSNSDFEDYANIIYEYDSNGRVRQTQERLSGSSCGCGGPGGTPATTDYTWSTNGGSPDLDTWNIHFVADRADDTRVIGDLNRWYQILTWVVQDEDDGTPTKELIWHYDYGTSGVTENRLTAIHNPSACSAYDESSPHGVTLRSSAGLIYEIDYDFITNTYDGYPERIRIKKGTSGTAETLKAYARTITERPDLATTITEYESTAEGNGRSTTLAYTFYDSGGDKVQPKQLDATHPSVSTAKNGPGASAVEKSFFDKRTGALRWTIDGEGYVKFYAFDIETGVGDLTVIDAKTSTLMTVIDDNWDGVTHGGLAADDTVPFSRSGSGTALDIDSSLVIDWLGRTRKATDAEGMITYFVYKEDEMRIYPAWNTSTYKTLLPIQISKTDEENRPEDVIALKNTVTPTKDASNEPTGAETYVNSDMASRTVHSYNISGILEHSDRYHLLPASGDGTRYTNYYRTAHEYDSMGRREYVITDIADESTYDREQVVRSYFDFVGRRIKSEEGVSDNTHDITTGKPTLSKTVEYFFDDPDSDSTPEQGEGDGNLEWIRRWHGTGASDYNDSEFRYDWRNRRFLTIPPLAPYALVKYDHLDRMNVAGSYSSTTNLDEGDDPATTANTTRLDLSKTYFDEMGRIYKTEWFDDPGDATPADALVTNRYYDRRSLAWAVDGANTGIGFTKYDGAGRRTQTSVGTQFDTAKYTSNAPDYPDDDEGLVQLTDLTLDEDGNVEKLIAKELNHDDTDGMDLTNNDDYIRTYTYNWYDDAHRLTDTAVYGTNNSSGWKDNSTAPTYGASAPARSDTVLVTTYMFDSEGRRTKVTDPRDIDTLSVYDKLSRVTQKEEDDAGSNERITKYEYNAQGSLTKITADLTTDQVTEYVYADSQNARWVTKIKYPATDTANGKTLGQPSDETYDRITFTYNVDGKLKDRTDQNGSKLTWSYDGLRRKTEEEVTTLGTYTGGAGSVDGAIRSFTWTYDSEGRVERVTSHTDTVPDTSGWTDAANQIKYTYNDADKLTKEEQEEDSAVDGSTLALDYGYGTDYSSGNYNRRDYIEYPDGRKIWMGYTHAGGASTLQDTINDKFNRVGQIARDNSGSIGDLLAEYDFNGMGRKVRRVHDEATGAYGNDTRMDLWHGTTGQYDGLDRFGRIVNMKHTDFSGTATDFLRREYTYDRNSNRTSIEHGVYTSDSQEFAYDNLNRLTNAKRGVLDSTDSVLLSDVAEGYNMDLLGNFTQGAGGIKINGTTANVELDVNETNELTTLDRPNPSDPAEIIVDPFESINSTMWTQDAGTWVTEGAPGSRNAKVSTLTAGEAILLAAPELDIINYEVKITFPTGSSTNKAGVLFAHDGSNNYHALVIERVTSSAANIRLYDVTSGSWGSYIANSGNVTVNDSTEYTLRIFVTQGRIEALLVGEANTLLHDLSSDLPRDLCGLYSDKTDVKFDDFTAYLGTSLAPLTPRSGGIANGSLIGGKLEVDESRGGLAVIEGFSDDYYIVEADPSSFFFARVWVRYQDPNNGYLVSLKGTSVNLSIMRVEDGVYTSLGNVAPGVGGWTTLRVRVYDDSGTDKIAVYYDSSLKLTVSDSNIAYGGVAFGGTETPQYDNVKIGYDNNGDGDIADVGDDIVWDEDFGSTSVTASHDHAGNLIDDGTFRYVYDAWNRLVKVQASEDSGAATIQTAEFDVLGRRIKKTVDNSGNLDGTVVYLYDGNKIIETRDGSGTLYQQFIHGTRYIDELVMVRVKDKGDLYVHQDANWNVIGMTDLGGSLVERHVYRPYGELTINQETSFGDRDGDGDVDATDKGTPGTDCTGTVSGDCRVLDLDFDGDYDSADATLFDSLPQGLAVHSGLLATNVDQPFGHQGLLFEPELGQYQNRARQYDPSKRRWLQRDSSLMSSSHDIVNDYFYAQNNRIIGPIGPSRAPYLCTPVGDGCRACVQWGSFCYKGGTMGNVCTLSCPGELTWVFCCTAL